MTARRDGGSTWRAWPVALLVALQLLPGACDRLPGNPGPRIEASPATFTEMYAMHCAACHGADGRYGPARPMNDPLYLALAPREDLRRIIADGVPGTLMPPFGAASGGPLSTEDVDRFIDGWTAAWAGTPPSVTLPPYAAPTATDARLDDDAMATGKALFDAACARCHVADPSDEASVLNATLLSLMSDQAVRTNVIAGRLDLGQPDFRTVDPAGPLSDADIDTLVAWILTHRDPDQVGTWPK